jgi:hypothetical protein
MRCESLRLRGSTQITTSELVFGVLNSFVVWMLLVVRLCVLALTFSQRHCRFPEMLNSSRLCAEFQSFGFGELRVRGGGCV